MLGRYCCRQPLQHGNEADGLQRLSGMYGVGGAVSDRTVQKAKPAGNGVFL